MLSPNFILLIGLCTVLLSSIVRAMWPEKNCQMSIKVAQNRLHWVRALILQWILAEKDLFNFLSNYLPSQVAQAIFRHNLLWKLCAQYSIKYGPIQWRHSIHFYIYNRCDCVPDAQKREGLTVFHKIKVNVTSLKVNSKFFCSKRSLKHFYS